MGQGHPNPVARLAWPPWGSQALQVTLNLSTSLLRFKTLRDQSCPQSRGRISAGPHSWPGPAWLSPPASCITTSSHSTSVHTHTCAHMHKHTHGLTFSQTALLRVCESTVPPTGLSTRGSHCLKSCSPTLPCPPPPTPPSFLSWPVPG